MVEAITKEYNSVYLYQESYKIDKLEYLSKNKSKMPLDKIALASLVISLIALVISIVYLPIILLFLVALAFCIWHYKKTIYQFNLEYQTKYEAYILDYAKKNNLISLSAIYPIYLEASNDKKILKLIYQNKNYICCSYDEIKEYNIYIDRFKTKNRLPDNPDKSIRSYIFELVFKNNKKIEIGFSNANRLIKIEKSFIFQQFANTKSINKIASTIDKIKNRNNI